MKRKNDSMKGKSRDEAACSDEVLPRSNYPRRFYLRSKKNNIRNVLRINAGIACSDKANEVEPRPNEDDMSIERWNNLLILTCHPYGILLTANIFSTDLSSLRDFLIATTEINAGIACSDKANEVEPRPNGERRTEIAGQARNDVLIVAGNAFETTQMRRCTHRLYNSKQSKQSCKSNKSQFRHSIHN
jgi:hypothetical protein